RDNDDHPSRHAQRRVPPSHLVLRRAGSRRGDGSGRQMNAAAGFLPLYQRRVALAVKRPIALVSQALTPVLWVLVVGPALSHAVGGFTRNVDYFTYVVIGQ